MVLFKGKFYSKLLVRRFNYLKMTTKGRNDQLFKKQQKEEMINYLKSNKKKK